MAARPKIDVNGLMKDAPAPAANLPGWGLSTAIPLPAIAESLPVALQDLARVFIGARERSGTAYLEAAAALADARATARHGEWHTFLATIEMSQDKAERMLNVHARAMVDASFARAIRSDFISRSAAALLAQPSTPPEIIDAVLVESAPPTHRQITTAIKDAKSATLRNLNGNSHGAPAPDLRTLRARLEALGGTLDPTSQDARGRYLVIPPPTDRRKDIRADLSYLAYLITAWESDRGATPDDDDALFALEGRAAAKGLTIAQLPSGDYTVDDGRNEHRAPDLEGAAILIDALTAAATVVTALSPAADTTVTPIPIAKVRTEPIDLSADRRLWRALHAAHGAGDDTAAGVAALALGCHLLGLRCELLSEVLDDEAYGMLVEALS